MTATRNQAAKPRTPKRPATASRGPDPASPVQGPLLPCPAATAECLRSQGFTVSLAVILGSGFHSVCTHVDRVRELPYRALPGFPEVSVQGHAGRVVLARLGPTPTLLLDGRPHYYEGHSLEQVTFPVRVLAALGVQHMVLTNAAGGIRRGLNPGDFLLLRDHINLMGANPLRGPAPAGCERFVDLSEVYDAPLRSLMRRAARAAGVRLREGVYLAVPGPSYETPAEIRAFARLGADAVGMSTVPEAIVARQHRIQVVGLSCITNRAAGLARRRLSHQEVLQSGARAGESATNVLQQFARLYAEMR